MKKLIFLLSVILIGIFLVNIIHAADSTNTANSIEGGCKKLYWFDENHKECGYKQFCGAYMYKGLQTFQIKSECENSLEIPTETCIGDSGNFVKRLGDTSSKCCPGYLEEKTNEVPQDARGVVYRCKPPVACGKGDTKQYTCPNGENVSWCTCTDNELWVCSMSPENKCKPQIVCTKDSNCPQINCIKAPCPINKCINEKCILSDSTNECDAQTPCAEGDCIQLPGKPGFKCIKDPCSYCPGNTECVISASYPSRLYCNCKGDSCKSNNSGCVTSIDLTTGIESTSCPTEDKPIHDEIEGSSPGNIEVEISKVSPEKILFKINKSEFTTTSNVFIKDKKLKINSSGTEKEIKIMPETASETAKQRLGDLGFTISLKEVGKKPTYQLDTEKPVKILGFMKTNAKISAEIDAETGEMTSIKKPWWSFLASGF